MQRDTQSRSVAKALSWRVTATIMTVLLVWVFTGRFTLSLAVGGAEFVIKMLLFWAHERVWDRVPFGRKEPPPVVLWFTGLSGSGKSTISQWVADVLRRNGARVEQLDGDTIRDLFPNTGFTRDARDAHIRRVGYLASRLEQNGVSVVASFVSPYEDSRAFVRGLCRNFVEVHVATPLDVCEARDVKGLYAKARRGEIRNFTGIDDPYEPPVRPDVVVNRNGETVQQAGRQVLEVLQQRLGRHWS
jgi:adenylylsulfate kinase